GEWGSRAGRERHLAAEGGTEAALRGGGVDGRRSEAFDGRAGLEESPLGVLDAQPRADGAERLRAGRNRLEVQPDVERIAGADGERSVLALDAALDGPPR